MKDFLAAPSTSPCPIEAADPDVNLNLLDHLVVLLSFCYQLARDCGENQRLLVETMPSLFGDMLVNCLHLCPTASYLPGVSRPHTKVYVVIFLTFLMFVYRNMYYFGSLCQS